MPSLVELCEKYFGHKDFYDVLRIPKNANEKQIRKAYHRLSLLVHPDRVEDHKKAEATEKFKVLGKVHSILTDKEKKVVYDETGSYDEEDEKAERDWNEYWRLLFKKITIEDINRYKKQYQGSEEELSDLKRAYTDGKGDMDFILECVPFSNTEEEPRLRSVIQGMIDSGEVPAFRAFTHETPRKRERRKRKWEKEAEEAEKMKMELGMDDGEDGLRAVIQSKQLQRAVDADAFFDHLAAKYSGGGGGTKKKGTRQQPARKQTKK